MNRPLAIGTLLCALMLCLCSGAEAKKKKSKLVKYYRPPDGSMEFMLNTDVPVTSEGAGFVGRFHFDYQWNVLFALEFSTGMATSPDDQIAPGNLVFGFTAGFCRNKKNYGYCLKVDLDMGISPAELDPSKAQASALGLYDQMSLASFLNNSLVLAPHLLLGFYTGTFCFESVIGPEMGLPLYQEETDEGLPYRGSVSYKALVGLGFGDLRGGLDFRIGLLGLADWTGQDQHTYCLTSSIALRFSKPYIDLEVGALIPIGGPSADMDASVQMMLAWHYYPVEDD